jgi:hypothetical protein
MSDEKINSNISYEVRLTAGRTGDDPNAPDWEVCELEDGQLMDSSDIFNNLTQAEANQIAGMWTKKKEEAESA